MLLEVVTTLAGYHARIKGANHEIIFATQVYRSKQSAINACYLVQAGASTAPIREVFE